MTSKDAISRLCYCWKWIPSFRVNSAATTEHLCLSDNFVIFPCAVSGIHGSLQSSESLKTLKYTYSVRSGVTTDHWACFQDTNPAVVSWDQLKNKIKPLTQQPASNFYCSYMFRPFKVTISLAFIIIIVINIKDWTLWSVPSPELQLLAPTLLRSSNCSPSLRSVAVWFQRDSVLWHSLQV